MKLRAFKQAHGFTIVETLIVLAVTGMLLVSALVMFRGRIARTQFSTALNEFDVKLRTVMNDVASGISAGAGAGDMSCESSGGEIGTGGKCLALGKAIHLGPKKTNCDSGTKVECDTLGIYNIKGDSFDSGKLVTDYFDASPVVNGSPETYTNGYGLHIISAKRVGSAPSDNISGIVFTQTFGQAIPTGNTGLQGAPSVKMYLTKGDIGEESVAFETNISDSSTGYHGSGDVEICLGSGTTNQFGLITIKSNYSVVTTKVEVVDSC